MLFVSRDKEEELPSLSSSEVCFLSARQNIHSDTNEQNEQN